jgi:hypothetical protein
MKDMLDHLRKTADPMAGRQTIRDLTTIQKKRSSSREDLISHCGGLTV